jgi:RNA polymerase sigma-70 factor (ECF subfamily)
VFQQVFQSVAAHLDGFQKERTGDTFRGWLRVITRNKVRDHFRRAARQPQAAGGTDAQIYFAQLADPDVDATDEPDAAADEEEYRQLLHGALQLVRDRVQPQTWQAFWKVVVEARTPEEVGEELSMRPGTVRVAKSRVLSRLRAELGELLH